MASMGFVSGAGLRGDLVRRDSAVIVKSPLLLQLAPLRSQSSSISNISPSHNLQTAVVPSQIHGTFIRPPPPAAAGPTRVLVLFSTDLRVEDNSALSAAARRASSNPISGTVLPAIMLDAKIPAAAGELKAALQSRGSDLATMRSQDELIEVLRKTKIEAVYFNHVVDNTIALQKQKKVIEAVQATGLQVEGFWSNTLVAPDQIEKSKNLADVTKSMKDMTIPEPEKAPENLPAIPTGIECNDARIQPKIGSGNSYAEKILAQMAKSQEALSLNVAPDMVYRLKPLLDAGAVSPRRVYQRVVEVMTKPQGYTFSELAWRSYVCSVLHANKAAVPSTV